MFVFDGFFPSSSQRTPPSLAPRKKTKNKPAKKHCPVKKEKFDQP
jgi:hypothetical protein